MHVRGRRALQDTMTAIRHRTTIAHAGRRLFPNGERHLRTRRALSAIHPRHLLDETLRIADRCRFSLDQPLGYQYPHELVPDGHTPQTWLRKLVEDGVRQRWPEGESPDARELIEKELKLIRSKQYEPYFLTVHDIVRFARSKDILCQGRGSAANSVVCYTLGVTSIDPARMIADGPPPGTAQSGLACTEPGTTTIRRGPLRCRPRWIRACRLARIA